MKKKIVFIWHLAYNNIVHSRFFMYYLERWNFDREQKPVQFPGKKVDKGTSLL